MAAEENHESLDDESLDSQLEWELGEGIPQFEDPFVQKYMAGREALIKQEKRQRHDHLYKQTMSPMARQAAKIMSNIRKRELKTIWTADFEESLAEKNGGNLYPGMMFSLARERMEKTVLWKIVVRIPKGALLHAHVDAMIDVDWLIDQTLEMEGMCALAPTWIDANDAQPWHRHGIMQFRYCKAEDLPKSLVHGTEKNSPSIWSESYKASTPIPIREVAASFPIGGEPGFKNWLWSRCVVTPEESLNHHHGLNAIWRKFQSTFAVLDWMLFYEPVWRRSLQRLFTQLAEDGITYVDLRWAFMSEYRLEGKTDGEQGYTEFFRHFGEEIEKFKQSKVGKRTKFQGARMIWTTIRRLDNKAIIPHMKECIRMKKEFPHLLCGFDFVAQEDQGRPLADLTPVIFWFKKKCLEEGVDIPFFFHAGECLGDGDETDNNLFDAILLGTRRIGHGYSLYKHPLLIDMVKDKKILVESCPISNEVLRLSSSILSHTLPALLSRSVAVSLNNDDPAVLGHGKNGLSHDFWQAFMAWENLGLEGLAVMAENSLRWCTVEDQGAKEWTAGVSEGALGKGIKASMIKDWKAEWERFCQWVCVEFVEFSDDPTSS